MSVTITYFFKKVFKGGTSNMQLPLILFSIALRTKIGKPLDLKKWPMKWLEPLKSKKRLENRS